LSAEGTRELNPLGTAGDPCVDENTDITDLTLLSLGGNSNFAGFNTYGMSSTICFEIKDPNEVVYIALSGAANGSGECDGGGAYQWRIAGPNGFISPVNNIDNSNANGNDFGPLLLGPDAIVGAGGYSTAGEYTFTPPGVGIFCLEFDGAANIRNFDITVANAGAAIPGRVYSENWNLRTPCSSDIINCENDPNVIAEGNVVFQNPFDGLVYVLTDDNFVQEIDFSNNAGFGDGYRGLTFALSFNMTGPGNTGIVADDRQSKDGIDATTISGNLFRVYLNPPDPTCYPEGICGDIVTGPLLSCADPFCLEYEVTQPGLVEIFIDLDGPDGAFTSGTADVSLSARILGADELTGCIPWDQLDGLGNPVNVDEDLQIIARYVQGETHFMQFDVENNNPGWTVNTIAPDCSVPDFMLNWDDSQLAQNDNDSGAAGQPLVSLQGSPQPAHLWEDQTADNATGFGESNTINTWFFATVETMAMVVSCVEQPECMAVPPVVTVTENTCDPDMDGFYDISPCADGFMIEFSIDGGMTYSQNVPVYPNPFLVRCVQEICAAGDISGLDPSNDAVDEVNGGNVMFGDATLTIAQTINGSSTLDENEISSSQTTGDLGISTGVSHDCEQDICGQLANSVNNLYNFDMPVCNLTIDLWDLDRDDEMLLTASGPNGPVTYTVNTIGAGVTQTPPNTFSSNNPNVNYPGDGPATLGMFSVTFDDCVTQISIDYYDASNISGDGGSFTIVFKEGCTALDCFSEDLSVAGSPIVCPTCEEDLVANLALVDPTCAGVAVDFDASASMGIDVNYEWDFDGDGMVDLVTMVPTTSFTYMTTGTFTVVLSIVDPSGDCEGPVTTSIELIICGPVTVICPPAMVTIVDGEPMTPDDLGEPLLTTNECNPNPTFTFSDDVVIGMCPVEEIITRTFTISDNCGVTQCIQEIEVLIDNPASINALPIVEEICLGESLILDASASIGDGLTYCWDVGVGSPPACDFTTATATQTYTEAGTYTITLSIEDQFGCTDEQVVGTVTVYKSPEAIATIDFDPCTLTVIYDASNSVDNFPQDNLIITWDFGDGNTSGDEMGTYVFDNCAAANTITLTVVDPDIPFPACNVDQLVFTIETDNEPPVLDCPPLSELQCGDDILIVDNVGDFVNAGGTATDNCDIINFGMVSLDTIPGDCPYIFQVAVVYEASDICGNTSQCTQLFDLLPGLPSASFPHDLILSCGDDISEAVTGTPDIQASMCTRPSTFTSSDVIISGSCPGDAIIERTFTITDDCGNTIEQTQIITIVNDLIPVLDGPPDITIECTAACDPLSTGGLAVVVDSCMPIDGTTNEVTVTFEDVYQGFDGTNFSGGIVGFIIRTFTAVDQCGNTGIDVQTISILRGDDTVLVCNDRINVSLNAECEGVTPDFLIEAPADTKYFLSLEDGQFGFAIDAQTTFDSIDFSVYIEAGEPVDYVITDLCGNSCWGEILFESNVFPQLDSPCDYIPGNIVDESGSIGDNDDTDLDALLGNNDDPIRGADLLGTVIITDGSCQDAFVIGTSTFRFNAAPKGAPLDIQYVDLELYFINVEDGSVIPFSFPSGVINVTPLTDIIQANGEYDVYVSLANGEATGDYSLHIEIGSCLPPCTTICGSDYPDEFITADEIEELLDDQCNATLIGDLIVMTETRGDMCEGIVHIETISGQFLLHGELIKKEILTQAYVELPINLDELDILAPVSVVLECGDDVTPESILEITEDGTQAYPHYFDFNQPVQDIICLEEVIVHFDVPVDTVQELVVVNDLWVLVDIVKKERRDSVRCVREGINPVPQFVPILLDTNLCNVLVEYSDVVIETCGSGKKIIREWTVIDWCQSNAQISLSQNIDVMDNVAPTIEKVDDITISIDPWTCAAVFPLPDLTHTDNCENTVLTETFSVSEGRVVDGFAVDLWLSDEPIVGYLNVSDDCGNETLDTFMIVVVDLVPPVPVCKDNLTMSLTSAMLDDNGGGGKILAESFDAGSNDGGCGDVKLQVRRVNGCCFEECDTPIYECTAINVKTGECTDSTLVNQGPLFGDFVKFCCGDVGSIVQVELQVTDKAGNTNSCHVSVIVEDKTQANLVCETVTIACDDDLATLEKPALSGTHCQLSENELLMIQESELEGSCGTDQIIREWYIDRDGSGEFSSGDPFCQQIILIDQANSGIDPLFIKWPKHFNGEVHIGRNLECEDDELRVIEDISVQMGDVQICSISEQDYSEPVWCVSECGLIASSLEQDTIFSSDACFKLINRWTVIDWCKWDPNGTGRDDDNDSSSDTFIAVEDWAQGVCTECPGYGANADNPVYFAYDEVEVDGYYTFDQIIKVIDDSSPEIDVVDSFTVQTSGGATSKTDATSCKGDDVITAVVTDFCGGSPSDSDLIKWQVTVFKNNLAVDIAIGNGSIIEANTGAGSPGDIHTIEWVARDGCGNETITITTVEFSDETLPTPFCIAGVSTNIPEGSDEVVVWPSDLDLGSFDNCTDADELRFVIVNQGVTPIMPGQDGFEDQGNFVVTCDDASTIVFVDMWVYDADGNGDFCQSSIQISDGCGQEAQEPKPEEQGSSEFFFFGEVYTESGDPVMNSIIQLNSNQEEYPKTTIVDEDGGYSFLGNREDFNYEIEVENDLNHANGVSTFDLLIMQQYILQTEMLDSPFKIIAADINNDGGVSVSDIVEARELILGKIDRLDFNESWRFINSDFEFVDVTNPWPFDEKRLIVDLSKNSANNDFIGVKIGDLNNTAISSNATDTEIRYKEKVAMVVSKDPLNGKKALLKIGEESIQSIQFALNTGSNRVVDAYSSLPLSTENYHIQGSVIGISWNVSNDIPEMFEISLEFSQELTEKDLENITLSNDVISSEVVNANTELKEVSLEIRTDFPDAYVLSQNTPNPFSKNTLISVYLPNNTESLTLMIYDVLGKEVYKTSDSFIAGFHNLSISADQLGGAGTYYYKLVAGEWSEYKTMVVTH